MANKTIKTAIETNVKAAPKAETKTVETKAVETKAVETKAVETKVAEKKAPAKKSTIAAKKVTTTTTKKAAEKTAEKNEQIFIQFSGYEFSDAELIEKVKANYIAETGKKNFKNVKLYVKPEEMMVYYVVNEKYLGKVSL